MRLAIIHLSDAHLKASDSLPDDRATRIRDAVFAETDLQGCLLTFTGDLAYSGLAAEYASASAFLTSVRKAFDDRKPGFFICDFLVPGNHDCDFSGDTAARDLLIDHVPHTDGAPPQQSIADACTAPQKAFFEFLSSHSPKVVVDPLKLLLTRSVRFDDTTILLRGLNTSFLSRKHERQGSLWFPYQTIDNGPKADVCMTLFHHPYNWFEATHARHFRATIEAASDFVLTGHNHEAETFEKRSSSQTEFYLEAAAFRDQTQTSGFHLVILDLTQRETTVHTYQWVDDRYSRSDGLGPFPFRARRALKGSSFLPSEDFERRLTNQSRYCFT